MDRQAVLEVMNRADAVYLATVDGVVPRVRALVNLRRRDQYPGPSRLCQAAGFTVHLSTSAASGKVRELRANPNASVYYCDPQEFHGVMLTGKAEILTDLELKKALWHDGWRVYWPTGPADPDYVVVCLRPTEATGWWGSTPFRLDPEGL